MNARSPLGAVLLPIAVAIAAAILPSSAAAADGTYAVYACKGPTGAALPTTGWTAKAVNGATAQDNCASGGGLRVSLPVSAVARADASWTFTAPAGTQIVGLGADRITSGFALANPDSNFAYRLLAGTRMIEGCTKIGIDCQADYATSPSVPGLGSSTVQLRLFCANGDSDCTNNVAVGAAFSRVAVTLKDSTKPQIVGHRVVDSGDTSGTFRVRFSATDEGSGLYRVRTLVDGKQHAVQAVTDGTCASVDPRFPDAHTFSTPLPCPLGLGDRDVAVKASGLPAGPHTILTEVEDAAGNTQTVNVTQFPRTNIAEGSGSDNTGGTTGGSLDGGTSDFQRLRYARVQGWFATGRKGTVRKSRHTIKRGVRALIRGKIVDRKGKGIVGATLDIYHVTRDGKRRLVKTGIKTRRQGLFTYIVSARVDSRDIRIAYRALRPGTITSQKKLRLEVQHKGKPYFLPENRPAKAKPAKGKPATPATPVTD